MKKLLVIDDDEGIRKTFNLALEDSEVMVDTASDGQSGYNKFCKDTFDLVILDLKMPGWDGVDTILKIREKDKLTPVYILTAFHKEYFARLKEARDQGIDFELLHKPLGSDKIVSFVHSVLNLEQPS